jgi:hypothetical protein
MIKNSDHIIKLRKRRLSNMTTDELERLNGVLRGKGHNWLTDERRLVCEVWAERIAALLKA